MIINTDMEKITDIGMDINMNNKRILITGGAGFIGSNLCDELINRECEVICLDNFSTGKRENIEHLIENKRFKLIDGDIRIMDDCRKAVDGVDYILHHAALGSVPRSVNDPVTSNDVNVSGFLNILVAAKDANVKRVVYAASSSTYGDSKLLPKVEEIIGKPLSPYAVTKYANELYADVFSKNYGLECIGLRYFNVFGQRQDPDGAYAAVIPLFIKKMIKMEPPVINGNGEYSRDFTYVSNVVQMNMLALTTENKNAVNTVYNTAFGEQTTLNQLFGYLRQYLSLYDIRIANLEAEYGPERVGDIPHSLADIGKAKRLLGYDPKYDMKHGLREAISWYWNNLK